MPQNPQTGPPPGLLAIQNRQRRINKSLTLQTAEHCGENGRRCENWARRRSQLRTPGPCRPDETAGGALRRPGPARLRARDTSEGDCERAAPGLLRRGPSGEGAGALAFDYGSAWKLEALTAQGQCVCPRWRRKRGEARRLAVRDNGPRRGRSAWVRRRGHSVGPGRPVRGPGERLRPSGRGNQRLSGGRLPGTGTAPAADPCRPGPGGTDRGAGTVSASCGNPGGPSQRTACIRSIQAEVTRWTSSLLKGGSGRQS